MDKSVSAGSIRGIIAPPSSKSYAQRAIALALLAEGRSILRNIEFCKDTRSALKCIEALGAKVEYIDDSTIAIEGGLKPQSNTLNVGESGLATRLFTPIASLNPTPITIEGQGNVLLEGTLSGTLENLTLKNLHIKGGNAQRWAYAKGDLVFENVTFEATSIYALHFYFHFI